MGTFQVVILSLHVAGLGVELAKDGEPRTGKHSFLVAVAGIAIQQAILYWGGWYQ